jgi:hypothetical protein
MMSVHKKIHKTILGLTSRRFYNIMICGKKQEKNEFLRLTLRPCSELAPFDKLRASSEPVE